MSGFKHEAVLYAGVEDFLDRTVPFILDGVSSGAAVMVAVPGANYESLRHAIPGGGSRLRLLDMGEVGRNPARIIPAWNDFASEFAGSGRPLRGIGEPIWASRTAAELDECVRHEGLLNVAFDGTPDFTLLCPYDTGSLPASLLAAAHCTHPVVADLDGSERAGRYDEAELHPFAGALPDPPATAVTVALGDGRTVRGARRAVVEVARAAGLHGERRDDLLVAISEIAANTIRHGRGGVLTAWCDNGSVICDVEGGTPFTDPLVGRVRPALDSTSGRGLWLANQLCDLVQIRSDSNRTVVRVHVACPVATASRAAAS